jgi:sulfatase modifying factor 1
MTLAARRTVTSGPFKVLLVFAAACAGACNSLTGASDYEEVTGCTGPLCSLHCEGQGGIWKEGACSCANGPLCGGSSGSCCGGTAPYCVTTSAGAARCSACTEADYECGAVCCEKQRCLDAKSGACGTAYGKAGQSCAGGLVCPAPRLDGSVEATDCCESITLPGGTFPMGLSMHGRNRCPKAYDTVGDCTPAGDENPQHPVTLSPYRLDRFDVTVGRFRKFVDAWDDAGLPEGAGGDAYVAGAGWHAAWNASLPRTLADLEKDIECIAVPSGPDTEHATWTRTPGRRETLPINCVTWYVAFAFCAWDGGRLPTEAEWEFAAANGLEGDLYPWGQDVPTLERAVYDCSQQAPPCDAAPQFLGDVGSHPMGENRWGHRNLSGNVFQWTLDAWAPYPTNAVTNYADVAEGFRVVRGGSIAEPPSTLRAASRETTPPSDSGAVIGIRCARSP